MNREDIEFLQGLQAKLNVADNDSSMNDNQANPRFWVVMEKELVESNDGLTYIKDEDNIWSLDYYVETINEEVEDFGTDEAKETWNEIDKNDPDAVCDFVNTNLYKEVMTVYLEERDRVVPNTLFLSKDAAQEHIRQNTYHYRNPRTYAMTAWRSPELERFMRLFKEFDFSKYIQ